MRPVHLSSRPPPPPQSVYHPTSQSHCPSIPWTVRPSSPPVHHIRPPSRHSVHDSSVRHPPPPPPRQSCTTSVRPSVIVRPSAHHCPAKRLSDCLSPSNCLYTILPHPSDCPTLSDPTPTTPTSPSDHPQPSYHLYDTPTSPSDHLQPSHRLYDTPTHPSDHPPLSHCLYDPPISPSACPSPVDCLTATTTCPPVRLSFPTIHHTHDSSQSLAVVNGEQSHTIHHTQDSSQSLAVMNGEQSRKAKKFHRAFTNYELFLRALDASSIYLPNFRHVAPPKSGEDAHVTHGKCDFGGATLNNPILGFSYMLPRLWDPGGVSSSPNTPRDLSRTIAPSRYPYALLPGYLVSLPNLRRWQDLRTSHVKLEKFIHGNITGLTTAMKTITRSINVIIPALMRPTPTHHECGNPYDRQSSCTNFNVTATSYIRVTQNLKRRVETTSPYERHTSRTFFARLLDPTSGLLHHTSGLPKILSQLRLTLLTMLGLWGVPYERPRIVDAPRTTPTCYPGGCVYVRCWFTTPRWGVTHFYQCLRLCSCGTKPQRSENHHFVMTSSWEPQCHHDIIMRTPRITGKPKFSCSGGL